MKISERNKKLAKIRKFVAEERREKDIREKDLEKKH